MLTIAYYFLQVILCSGMLMGYYWLVLRNKRFHQYNRFYLLAATILSCIVPLLKISFSHPVVVTEQPQVMQLLSVVADNNSQIDASIRRQGFVWNWDILAMVVYFTVAAVLLTGMLRAFVNLYHLLKSNSCKNVGDVYLVLTQAKGTPFSFFRYIFWNEQIDLRSDAGKQILQHELTHVQQKHSFDKLFIQVLLIGGWFNPFFWLLKREMEMIHEFIADKKAVENGDTASLAQMLLTAAYPQQKFGLTHPFFFSPIKRRLQMLTNNRNPRFSYIRRLVVLPLLAVLIVVFAFRGEAQKMKEDISITAVVEQYKEKIMNVIASDKPGENTADSIFVNGVGIAKNDVSAGKGRFVPVMIALAAIKAEKTGADIPELKIPERTSARTEKPRPYAINGRIVSKAILAKLDMEMVSMIQVMADDKAVSVFGEVARDGIVSIKTKNPLPDDFFREETTGLKDTVNTAIQPGPPNSFLVTDADGNVNWRTVPRTDTIRISAENNHVRAQLPSGVQVTAESIDIVNASVAAKKDMAGKEEVDVIGYGNGSAGSKKKEIKTPASFPGGEGAWAKYLSRNLNSDLVRSNGGPPGIYTVVVSFNVNAEGRVSDVHAENDPGYGTRAEAERMVLKGPRWVPAVNRNGVNTGSTVKRSIPFEIPAGTDPIKAENKLATIANMMAENGARTKKAEVVSATLVVDMPVPSFPGGLAAWTEYLRRNVDVDAVKKNGGPPGKYTVVVGFTVNADGSLSNISALNNPGYGTKDMAEKLISKGPRWVPAMRDGKNISASHKQSITFVVSADARAMNPRDFNLKFTTTAGEGIIIDSNSTAKVSVRVPGIKKGDQVLVTPQVDSREWSIYSAWVEADDLVSVRLANNTNKKVKINSGDYKIVSLKQKI